MLVEELALHCPNMIDIRRREDGSIRKLRLKQSMPCEGQVPFWAMLTIPERIKLLSLKLDRSH